MAVACKHRRAHQVHQGVSRRIKGTHRYSNAPAAHRRSTWTGIGRLHAIRWNVQRLYLGVACAHVVQLAGEGLVFAVPLKLMQISLPLYLSAWRASQPRCSLYMVCAHRLVNAWVRYRCLPEIHSYCGAHKDPMAPCRAKRAKEQANKGGGSNIHGRVQASW